MKTAIYARVSSEKQAEKDLSIPGQLKALRKYAFDNNWEIVAEYIDDAESARSADRPSFQQMITAAKKKDKPFNTILVWKLSRFARNREDSIIYKSLLRKRGISVVSINERIDDTASGRLLEGMIEVIDEFYSANLAQDTMRGMKENVSRGYFNGGIVPFGYRKVKVVVGNTQKTKLEPDEMESPVVKRAFHMALEGKGGKEIANALNAEGLRTRDGKPFGSTITNYWLRNPVYTGTLVWNKNDRTGDKPIRKPTNEVLYNANAHKALVPKEDFDRIQNLLSNRRPSVRHPKTVSSQYLLSGLAYCGNCNSAMIGTTAKSGKYLYYECNAHYKKGKHACHGIRIAKNRLEEFIISRIRKNILTEENLTELVHLVNEELLETTSHNGKELQQVEHQLKQVSKRLSKLYAALENGKLDLDDLAPRIKELRTDQHELQERRNRVLTDIESKGPKPLDADTVVSYVRELEQLLSQTSFLQQKSFLRSFVERVEVNPNTVIIDYEIPLPIKKNRTSSREVLDINRFGRPYRSRTCDTLIKS